MPRHFPSLFYILIDSSNKSFPIFFLVIIYVFRYRCRANRLTMQFGYIVRTTSAGIMLGPSRKNVGGKACSSSSSSFFFTEKNRTFWNDYRSVLVVLGSCCGICLIGVRSVRSRTNIWFLVRVRFCTGPVYLSEFLAFLRTAFIFYSVAFAKFSELWFDFK